MVHSYIPTESIVQLVIIRWIASQGNDLERNLMISRCSYFSKAKKVTGEPQTQKVYDCRDVELELLIELSRSYHLSN